MLNFVSYDNSHKQTEPVKLPAQVDSVSVSFDGGRVLLSINGKSVFESHMGGNDCNVEIDRK